jgi:hypothetical protein
MTRETTTITTLTCDRCGRDNRACPGRWAWANVQVEGVLDEMTFPVGMNAADICPSCMAEFRQWWSTRIRSER